MKIIHTSDWHIGREFENESLQAEQSAFLSWLTEQIKIHAVDLVVVAGDIYCGDPFVTTFQSFN